MLLAITPGDGRNLVPWLDALIEAGLEACLWREAAPPGPRAVKRLRRLELGVVHARSGVVPWLGSHFAAGRAPGSDHARPFGASAHGPDELASAAGWADYVLLSPVWAPTSKPDDPRPRLGPDALRMARTRHPDLRILALGGVTPERYREALAAGADGAAVLGDLFGQPTPAAAARRLRMYRR